MKMLAKCLTCLAMLWLGALEPASVQAATQEGADRPPPRRPNIVMILADDLGYADLGSFGHPTIRTPHLDRMAREGLRLTSHYAAFACTPARAQLLTGRYAPRVGLSNVLLADNPNGLKASELTFATLLQQQGYQTMMVGKWHLGHADPAYWPTAHGFDHFVGLPYSHDIMKPWVQTDVPLRRYRDREVIEEYPDAKQLTTFQTDEAVKFIDEAAGKDQPFLLYLAYTMPHLPLGVPDDQRGRSRAGAYGDVIEVLDDNVGRIRAALDAKGIAGDTLVIFTSDNGPWANLPPRMLNGGVEAWDHGTAGPFRGSKGSTWEGGGRVPAIAWWPGTIPGGRSTPEMTSMLDLLPTFVRLAGGSLPADLTLDGVDLTPLLLGETDVSPRDHHYFFLGGQLQAIRMGPWKLRSVPEEPRQLFHLERDPAEQYNVIEQNPDVAHRLEERLEAFRRERQTWR